MKGTYRCFAVLLAALLIAALLPPAALAAGGERVIDHLGVLTDSELVELNEYAGEISRYHELDIAILLTSSDAYDAFPSLAEYAGHCYTQLAGLGQDGFILAIDEDNGVWDWAQFGSAEGAVTEDAVQGFADAYAVEDTYYYGVVAYFDAVAVHPMAPTAGQPMPRLVDLEGLLTPEQAANLESRLDEISRRHQFDVVVAVVPSLEGREAHRYAADFFERNGFGYGADLDGAILLLATEDRDYGFATLGYGMEVFTPAGQDHLVKLFLPHLKNDRYDDAFMAYAQAAEDFLTQAATGAPYDRGNIPTLSSETMKYRLYGIAIGLILALVIAWIITAGWKRQLVSVGREDYAHAYIRPDSMVLTGQQDIFLYRNVNRVRRAQSSGGGGGAFTTSSGRSASGRSGKY